MEVSLVSDMASVGLPSRLARAHTCVGNQAETAVLPPRERFCRFRSALFCYAITALTT